MGRQPCCDKFGLKRGPWTIEEDRKLMNFILENGIQCWRTIPKLAGFRLHSLTTENMRNHMHSQMRTSHMHVYFIFGLLVYFTLCLLVNMLRYGWF